MAFRLTNAESAQRDEHVSALEIAAAELGQAVATYNEAVAAAWEALAAARDAYNDALEQARDFAGDIALRFQSEIDEKSDRWQEGEKGQAANALSEAWDGLDLDDIEMDPPEPIEELDLAHRDELEGAPSEAD